MRLFRLCGSQRFADLVLEQADATIRKERKPDVVCLLSIAVSLGRGILTEGPDPVGGRYGAHGDTVRVTGSAQSAEPRLGIRRSNILGSSVNRKCTYIVLNDGSEFKKKRQSYKPKPKLNQPTIQLTHRHLNG